MKAWQFQVSVILGALSLILAFAVIKTGKTSQKLQNDLQSQQNEINSGLLSQRGQQLGNGILQDMAVAAARNEKMHKLLGENGYNIQFQQQAPTAPATGSQSKKQVTP